MQVWIYLLILAWKSHFFFSSVSVCHGIFKHSFCVFPLILPYKSLQSLQVFFRHMLHVDSDLLYLAGRRCDVPAFPSLVWVWWYTTFTLAWHSASKCRWLLQLRLWNPEVDQKDTQLGQWEMMGRGKGSVWFQAAFYRLKQFCQKLWLGKVARTSNVSPTAPRQQVSLWWAPYLKPMTQSNELSEFSKRSVSTSGILEQLAKLSRARNE